jgi:hypothetical protein
MSSHAFHYPIQQQCPRHQRVAGEMPCEHGVICRDMPLGLIVWHLVQVDTGGKMLIEQGLQGDLRQFAGRVIGQAFHQNEGAGQEHRIQSFSQGRQNIRHTQIGATTTAHNRVMT